MSGFGTCGACKKSGFTRKGASHCTRCEKKVAKGQDVPPVVTVVAEPSAAAPKKKKRKKRYVKSHGRVTLL